MAQVKVVLDEAIGQVNPNIFGHFIEHLGRCVYEGIYVGPDSKIPNTRGLRNDVIDALRKIRPSVRVGPAAALQMIIIGKMGLEIPLNVPGLSILTGAIP